MRVPLRGPQLFLHIIIFLCTFAGIKDCIMSYEYTISIPSADKATFRQIARRMGWTVSGPRKLSAYERSKIEAREGKVQSFESLSELFNALNA